MSYLLQEKLAEDNKLSEILLKEVENVNTAPKTNSGIFEKGPQNFKHGSKVRGNLHLSFDNDGNLIHNFLNSGLGRTSDNLEANSVYKDTVRNQQGKDELAKKEYDERMKDVINNLKTVQEHGGKSITKGILSGAGIGAGIGAGTLGSIFGAKGGKEYIPLGAIQGGVSGALLGAGTGLTISALRTGKKAKAAHKDVYNKLTKDEAENLLKLKHKILSETAQNANKAHVLKSTTNYYY